MIFKNLIQKIRQKFFVWRIKKGLIKNYDRMLEVDKILEAWITKRILEGQQNRRNELLEKQQKIGEMTKFLEFLRKI